MKKTAIWILALFLSVQMAGCGQSTPDEMIFEKELESTSEETKRGTESEWTPGTVQDGTYTNTYMGIGCTLDEATWVISGKSSKEIIKEASDAVASEESKKMMEQADMVCDVDAYTKDHLQTLTAIYDYTLQGMNISEKEYIEAGTDFLKNEYAKMGIKGVEISADKQIFAGKMCNIQTIKGQMDGMRVYVKQVVIKKDDIFYVVNFTSYYTDTTAQMMNCFYAL